MNEVFSSHVFLRVVKSIIKSMIYKNHTMNMPHKFSLVDPRTLFPTNCTNATHEQINERTPMDINSFQIQKIEVFISEISELLEYF